MAKKRLFDEQGNEVKWAKLKKPFYKKVWFWVILFLLYTLSTMGGEDEATPETANPAVATEQVVSKPAEAAKSIESVESTKPVEAAAPAIATLTPDEQYQAILDEYTVLMQEAALRLTEEYNAEYPSNTGGLEGLAQLSNDKIGELAKISNDGVGEMANVYFKSGSGVYEEYEVWAGKLMDIYMTEATLITDAYMLSAQ